MNARPINWHYDILNHEDCNDTPWQKVDDCADYAMRTTDRGSFMVFRHTSVDDARSATLQTKNWKAHLSISIYDIPKTWNEIFPLFSRHHCELFKVTRLSSIPDALSEVNHAQFKRCQQYSADEHPKIAAGMEARAESITRVALGNEITIYPTPGREWQCRLLLCDIEVTLKNYRSGHFDRASHQIGAFTSVRHTGLGETGYQAADLVSSFNPDNVFEMFYPLDEMTALLTKLKNIFSLSDYVAEDIKIHIFNHLSDITNILVLQDLAHLLDMPEYEVLNQKPSGFSIFKDSHKSEIISAIKTRVLQIIIPKAILFPEEDQAIRDILSIRRNKYDRKTPKSLQQYESLLLDQQIRIATLATVDSEGPIRAARASKRSLS